MNSPFADMFGSLGQDDPRNRRDKGPTPLPEIHGKRFDDVLYVKATDVADALHQLGPTVNKRLIDKLRLASKPKP